MMREGRQGWARARLMMKAYQRKLHRSSNAVYCAITSNAHTRRENWERDLPETAVAPLRALLPLVQRISIENGEFKYPVQEVTIAGNLRDMLKNIEMVGNDVTFVGSIAAPTLKIGKMVISGA